MPKSLSKHGSQYTTHKHAKILLTETWLTKQEILQRNIAHVNINIKIDIIMAEEILEVQIAQLRKSARLDLIQRGLLPLETEWS